MADPALQIDPPQLTELRRILAAHLPGEEVWAHGSRVQGTAHETSDLDLVVRRPGDLKTRQGRGLRELRAALSESDLPLLVEILDWAALPPAFADNIARRHVVIQAPNGS